MLETPIVSMPAHWDEVSLVRLFEHLRSVGLALETQIAAYVAYLARLGYCAQSVFEGNPNLPENSPIPRFLWREMLKLATRAVRDTSLVPDLTVAMDLEIKVHALQALQRPNAPMHRDGSLPWRLELGEEAHTFPDWRRRRAQQITDIMWSEVPDKLYADYNTAGPIPYKRMMPHQVAENIREGLLMVRQADP